MNRAESVEAGGGPATGSNWLVEFTTVAEEGELNRDGTEADPDEERSLDEEDQLSESVVVQADEGGSVLRGKRKLAS